MMLFRPATLDDFDAILSLAHHCGVGITTLPKDEQLLNTRLTLSQQSFQRNLSAPQHEYYLFVMENPTTHRIVGTSGIESLTGADAHFYSYRYHRDLKTCASLDRQSRQDYLTLTHELEGCSEVCTLYLEPEARQNGNGLLLSLARFLFIAQFPHRFAPRIIADMRGVSNEHGQSPFWDALGAHFFNVPFETADQLTLLNHKQFIADLMPDKPIYINLLSPDAQAVIGQPHPSSLPAINILKREGFQYQNIIDIFDAGPTLTVARDEIRTGAKSHCLSVHISSQTHTERMLIANTSLHFRATISHTTLDLPHQTCSISSETADILHLNKGDLVRVSNI